MKSTCGWTPYNTHPVCQHCHIPFVESTWICREGYSYHQECHKCYYCGESDLRDSETFNGVIFCSACSQRIFHNGKNVKANRHSYVYEEPVKSSSEEKVVLVRGRWSSRADESARYRSRPGRRSYCAKHVPPPTVHDHESSHGPYDVPDRPDNRWSLVTCASKMITSTQTDKRNSVHDSEQVLVIHDMTNRRHLATSTENVQPPKSYSIYTKRPLTASSIQSNNFARNSICMAVHKSTNCSRDMLPRTDKAVQSVVMCVDKCVRCHEVEVTVTSQKRGEGTATSHKRGERRRRRAKREVCGATSADDVRMAALGTSTEIANQALLDVEAQASDSTVFQQYEYSIPKKRPNSDTMPPRRHSSDLALIDRRVRSLLKLPFRSFKRNILDRSSLIDAVMYYGDKETTSSNIMDSIRTIFNERTSEYQARGVKKLYKTIHRKQEANRLGWIPVTEKDAYALNSVMRCSHYHRSNSYRYMRKQVMKLAGPTSDQLSMFAETAKEIVTPRLLIELKNLLMKAFVTDKTTSSNNHTVHSARTNPVVLSRHNQMKTLRTA